MILLGSGCTRSDSDRISRYLSNDDMRANTFLHVPYRIRVINNLELYCCYEKADCGRGVRRV